MASLHDALNNHLTSAVNASANPGGARLDISKVDWSWPPWCLNQRAGQLEVYVYDDETSTGGWMPGIAMTRVVDPHGKDAYLHVQYVWDGEEYVEDFLPSRVRQAGQLLTIEDLIRSGSLGPEASSNSGYNPAPAAPVVPAATAAAFPRGDELAEVVIDCISADGVDLRSIPLEHRAIALQVKNGSVYSKIGRQHQPDFFQRLVPQQENLASISRSHFEITWEPQMSAPQLRQLSRNKLLVDSNFAPEGAPMPVPDGTRLSFCRSTDVAACFLALRLTLRTRASVDSSGMHPAVRTTQQMALAASIPVAQQMHAQPLRAIAAVLECVKAPTNFLTSVPADVKAIPLEFDKVAEIGRNHQPRTFEELLKTDAAKLSFVSRTHCRVKLIKGPPPGAAASGRLVHMLEVENLSANVLFVAGRPLCKNERTSILEGDTVAFSAAVTGEDNKFLEFMLRRARLVT